MFNFFGDKETASIKAHNEKLTGEMEDLRAERLNLKDEVGNLKLKKKVEEEDIKHMVKMKEERLDLANEKKQQALEAEFATKNASAELEKQQAIGSVKDEYRDKMEVNLVKQVDDMKDMYSEILKRLPDVTVKMKA